MSVLVGFVGVFHGDLWVGSVESGCFQGQSFKILSSGSLSRYRAGSDVLENLRDVPGPMQNCDHRERRTGGVVHHEVRVDAPEFHRPVGQILSSVADARPSGELLESLLERRQNAKGAVDAVLANELCDRSTSALALAVSWYRLLTRASSHAPSGPP